MPKETISDDGKAHKVVITEIKVPARTFYKATFGGKSAYGTTSEKAEVAVVDMLPPQMAFSPQNGFSLIHEPITGL